MGGKLLASIVILLLIQKGFGVISQTVPESGSIIAGFVGEDISAFCEVETAEGDPQITLWHRREEDDSPGTLVSINVDDARFVTVGEPVPGNRTLRTNLTIISLTLDLDTDIVFCGTAGSLEAANFTITVYDLPSAPTSLEVESVGSSYASFSWQEPGNLGNPPVSHYLIVASPVSSMENSNITAETNETNGTVSMLLPGTTYNARVIAMSPLFASGASLPVTFTTNSTVPLVECASMPTSEDGVITVEWTVVHTGGLNLTETIVEYRQLEGTLDGNDTLDGNYTLLNNLTDPLQMSVEVFNFSAGFTYIFRITSENELGTSGPVECPAVTLIIGRPSTPETPTGQSMAPDTATLTLNTTVAGVGEPLHTFGFTVETFLINETDNSTILVESIAMAFPEYSSGENVQFVVDGLMTGETYRFAAQAYNQFGVSEFSALSNPITPEFTVPVISEVIVTRYDTNVTITWSYVHTGGFPLSEIMVLVEYRVGDGTEFLLAPDGNITRSLQSALSILGEEFRAGEMYEFQVTAVNERGSSDPVVSQSIVSTIGTPSVPDVPTIQSVDPGSVTLVLSTAQTGIFPDSSQLFGFEVIVIQVADGTNFTKRMEFPMHRNGEQAQITVDDLVHLQSYQFACRAFNSFGESEYSNLSEAQEIPEEPTDSGSSGLSAGAVAGIIIAIVFIAAIILVVFVIAVCLSIKKDRGPRHKRGTSATKDLVYNTSYVSSTKPQETPLYEAINEKEKKDGLEQPRVPTPDNLYDSLAAHQAFIDPHAAENPLYSGGATVRSRPPSHYDIPTPNPEEDINHMYSEAKF